MTMFDLKAAKVQGAASCARARVLWRDGLLRAYSPTGMVFGIDTTKPVKMKGYLNSWLVDSSAGPIVIKSRCMTCGGPQWWKLMRIPGNKLWPMQ